MSENNSNSKIEQIRSTFILTYIRVDLDEEVASFSIAKANTSSLSS